MQTCKLQVVELAPEHRRTLRTLGDEVRQAHNYIWRMWEHWHTVRDSSAALRELLSRDKAWRTGDKVTRGERPKWTVQCWPNEFGNVIMKAVARRFPTVNSRCLSLLLQKIRGNCTTKQSSAAPMKWWIAILLDLDSRATARRPLPLSFDSGNAKIFPADERGRVWLEVRLDRIERPGKKKGASTPIRMALKTAGKRAAYSKPVIEMAAGKRKLSGAQLQFDSTKNKWFACLTYEPEETIKPSLDHEAVAILRPGRSKSCWLLRMRGRTVRIGGRGHHVAHVRKSLLLQRWGRQHNYTYSPKRKGRGNLNAFAPIFKLTNRWLNFTKRCNEGLVADVCRECVERGIGRIVLVNGNATRLLAKAGKIEGREDSSGWPWYMVQNLLKQKAQKLGIAVEVCESFSGASRTEVEAAPAVAV